MLLTGGALTQGAVVDASAAEQAVREYWPALDEALKSDNRALLHDVEADAAVLVDDAGLRIEAAKDQHFPSRPLTGVKVWVQPQTEYPAQFLAKMDTLAFDAAANNLTDKPISLLSVFQKDVVGAPWKSVLATTIEANKIPPIALDADGLAMEADEQNLLIKPSTVSQQVASRENAVLDGRADPGPPFASAPISSEFSDAMKQDRANGFSFDAKFKDQGSSKSYQYKTSDGGALTMGAINLSIHRGSPRGQCLFAGSETFPLLQPGAYSVADSDNIATVAVTVPPTGAAGGASLNVIAYDGGPVHQSGESKRLGRSGLPNPTRC